MTALSDLLSQIRATATSERDKGTRFEDLTRYFLTYEPCYQNKYSEVLTYAHWAEMQGLDQRDTGIDLVALTANTHECHAIQCKFYHKKNPLSKSDLDSFFTASGKYPFTHRIIVITTDQWTIHAREALNNQQIPVSTLTLNDFENSQIDWQKYQNIFQKPIFKAKKELREHQKNALIAVIDGFKRTDRGKLIMACGTGKTFTSLKIAEALVPPGGNVLFLVPSLALLSQTLTEWSQQSDHPLQCFAVCSDADIGKKEKEVDSFKLSVHELNYPATTESDKLAREIVQCSDKSIRVIFSTYHSIAVINEAQTNHGLPQFNLIICDEAHRTTGATFENEEESAFFKIHDGHFIQGDKRLYMTATPRIYGNMTKATAEQNNIALYSMDDLKIFGPELFIINFSEAVKRNLLVDYKVIVLAIQETHVSRRLQSLIADENNQITIDDVSKIVGCWKALSKQDLKDDSNDDHSIMQRAVAFCQIIGTSPEDAQNDKIHKIKSKKESQKVKIHKISSKNVVQLFKKVVEAYKRTEPADSIYSELICEADHIDGRMNAIEKNKKLDWLKADLPENTCRILSNVRCLSEGVDVPALDAILFLSPRNSQVDVVQSVGRVLSRTSPGKKRGYVILPVVIPAGMEPHKALDDNKTYAVVWQVLNALRSHDDHFDAMINKLDLIGNYPTKMEVIAVSDSIQKRSELMPQKSTDLHSSHLKSQAKKKESSDSDSKKSSEQKKLEFNIIEIERAIYAKIVQKVGNRHHWEDWANDIAKIAQAHIQQINRLLEEEKARFIFKTFADELRNNTNPAVSDAEIIEMLAQHLITKPVFDTLFSNYPFAAQNPLSKAMQDLLAILLQASHLKTEIQSLQGFYDSVKQRAEGIESVAGKQKIIIELYDKFFRNAFPRLTERLGIVYTPIEVVDFILHSVDHLLKTEFGKTFGSPGVNIIDPFVGTGTFITRLLQNGLIDPNQLPQKYENELFANEIVLLAYYIAAINIESVYHDIIGGEYKPFPGICLTDTFQLYETEDLVDGILMDNNVRRKKQKKLDIRVIIGNPPYSVGQKSANDDAANIDYPLLDKRISDTYISKSLGKGGKRSGYDSYIRAIRWASDRIDNSGIIGFVTNAGFIEKNATDGLRLSLAQEFSSIYIFNLRGDIRKNMLSQGRAKEGQNIFGSGSMTGIAITLFVKNSSSQNQGNIYYYDIGNDLNKDEKLYQMRELKSIAGISITKKWQFIQPDQHGDWLNQRNTNFSDFIVLGSKKSHSSKILFEIFSNGVVSGRDIWVYNYSKEKLSKHCQSMTYFYNEEIERYKKYIDNGGDKTIDVQTFVQKDRTRMSWGGGNWKSKFSLCYKEIFNKNYISRGLYRPFTKMWHYGAKIFNHSFYSMPRIFPDINTKNLVICISGVGANSGFSALITDHLPCLDNIEKGQCFPMYLYSDSKEKDEEGSNETGLFFSAVDLLPPSHEGIEGGFLSLNQNHPTPCPLPLTGEGEKKNRTRREAITDEGLAHFQNAYPGEKIKKEDLFYYIYGLLHSPEYREKYGDNLSKELPRIPCVKSPEDFWAFSKAGRELAHWHLNYETVEKYPLEIDHGKKSLMPEDYRVEKMKYGKIGKEKNLNTVIYNERITLRGIPIEAYEYIVNGKPALDWVIERQGIRTDKDSGIINDANDWANETMGNPAYPLELFQRVVTVSLETMKIVKGLPGLN